MSSLCDCHGKVVAAILIATAAALAWCALHIRYGVLISQQPCDTTYMNSAYTHLDLRSSPDNGLGAQSSPSSAPALDLSQRAQAVAAAAKQLATTVTVLSHSNYKLWRYTGDGIVSSGSSHDADRLALPVLFIPGNGGAHEMGRSLASETARRVSRLGPRAGASAAVDWYLLDLGGDWSAFDGEVLEQQVLFTLTAMRHLARLHNITAPAARHSGDPEESVAMHGAVRGKDRGSGGAGGGGPQARRLPRWPHPGLVVVGHSMGGVVAVDALARAAEDPELGPSLAALLLTFGSPHLRPAVPGHPSLREFYSRAAVRSRPVVPVVALAGGLADVQVAVALTDPWALAPLGFSRHLEMSQLAGGWCPASHNGLTSCNQGMVRLGQALVDMAQDALPGLQAAHKAAALATSTSTAPGRSPSPTSKTRQPPPPPAPSDAESPCRQQDAPYADDDGALYETADGADAGRTAPKTLPWDWALRRIDQHLSHPAQPYLAAALVATTPTAITPTPTPRADAATSAGDNDKPMMRGAAAATSKQEDTDPEERLSNTNTGQEELLRRARRALTVAPSNSGSGSGGGVACSGANLAWYLQYNTPQAQPIRRRGRSPPLRLLSTDVEDGPATGRMYSWQLSDPRSAVTGSKNITSDGASNGRGLEPRGWVTVVSGANPCTAFRVWLSVTVEQPAVQQPPSTSVGGDGGDAGVGATSGGGGAGSGTEKLEALEAEARSALQGPRRTVRHDVEVTGLAAPLPALARTGRWRTRAREDLWDVTQGRDYQSRGAWLLLLPPSLVAPLLQLPGAPRVDWSGSGGATVTLTVTLWLGELSYKPAFRVVAAPLLSPEENMHRPQPLQLRPFAPAVLVAAPTKSNVKRAGKGDGKTTKNKLTSAAATTSLLVPIDLPYLKTDSAPSKNIGHSVAVAAIVRWLGLYRYVAVRIVRLDLHSLTNGAGGASQKPASWKPSGQGAGGDGDQSAINADGCLHPVVVMAGGEGAGGGEKLRTTQLLRVAANLTLFSLETCATHPGGCDAVTAILDPTCSYKLDVVPYIASHLQSHILANTGQLWLGAQLAALLAVVALMTEKCQPGPEKTSGGGCTTQRHQGRRRFWGWPVLPLEGLAVLQAGLRSSLLPPAALLAAAAAAAAFLAHHHTTTTAPTQLTSGHMMWPSWVLPSARAAGLCPQAHLLDCGWGAPSLLLHLQQLLLPRAMQSVPSMTLAPAPASSVGSTTASSVLDWMVLAAASATLTWLLCIILQGAATLAAVATAAMGLCWRLAVVLPAAILTAPLRWLLRRNGCRRSGCQPIQTPNDAHDAAREAMAMTMMTVCVRWLLVVLPLSVAVCLVGALGAVPCGALMVALMQLAMSLTSPSVVLTAEALDRKPISTTTKTKATSNAKELTSAMQEDAVRPTASSTPATVTADVTVARSPRRTPPGDALGASEGSEEQRKADETSYLSEAFVGTSLDSQQGLMTSPAGALMQRRYHMAWLLYYTSYGMCAAPALAAAVRPLVARPEDVRQLALAVFEVVMAATGARGNGLRAGGLWLVRVGIPVAVRWLVKSVVPVVRDQGGYVLAGLHCLLLTVAVRGGGRVSMTTALGGQLCRYAAVTGCVVLGLGWWLAAPGTAHFAAAGVAGTQLLATVAAAAVSGFGPKLEVRT